MTQPQLLSERGLNDTPRDGGWCGAKADLRRIPHYRHVCTQRRVTPCGTWRATAHSRKQGTAKILTRDSGGIGCFILFLKILDVGDANVSWRRSHRHQIGSSRAQWEAEDGGRLGVKGRVVIVARRDGVVKDGYTSFAIDAVGGQEHRSRDRQS